MTVTVKNKTPLVVPPAIRRRAGLNVGDQVEFRASGGVITITPKVPAADDEYTPEQRRMIDAQLDEAEKGPFHGPFDTADEMITHIKGELKKRAAAKKLKRRR
jgi:bifunctional DNA-binding transcriptional regulator/antitoxin component of YhaV-PrlF toxin-antitoxin module